MKVLEQGSSHSRVVLRGKTNVEGRNEREIFLVGNDTIKKPNKCVIIHYEIHNIFMHICHRGIHLWKQFDNFNWK
jgi:hypothetical protein